MREMLQLKPNIEEYILLFLHTGEGETCDSKRKEERERNNTLSEHYHELSKVGPNP